MRYILAIFLPPVAVLSCGKTVQFLVSIPLTLLFWIPGAVHALFVVANYHADRRNERLIGAIAGGSRAVVLGGTSGPGRKAVAGFGVLASCVAAVAISAVIATRDRGRGPVDTTPSPPAPRAPVAASPNVETGGLPLDKRREICAATYRAGMLATYEAEWRAPIKDLPTEADDIRRVLVDHHRVYEAIKDKGRAEIAGIYGVDAATLDAIDAEGTKARWPLPDVPNPYFGRPRPDEPPASREENYRAAVDRGRLFQEEREKAEAEAREALGRKEAGAREAADASARSAAEKKAGVKLRAGQALEKAGKPAAALTYYREILKDFAETGAADEAAARVEALTGAR